jgi:hypothetical protein
MVRTRANWTRVPETVLADLAERQGGDHAGQRSPRRPPGSRARPSSSPSPIPASRAGSGGSRGDCPPTGLAARDATRRPRRAPTRSWRRAQPCGRWSGLLSRHSGSSRSCQCLPVMAFAGPAAKEPFAYAAARWWDEGKNASTLDAAAALAEWPMLASGPRRGRTVPSDSLPPRDGLGPRPHVEVIGARMRAGVFVSPPVYEPFGLAALEAAASGARSCFPTSRPSARSGTAPRSSPPAIPGPSRTRIDLLAADARFRRDMARAAADRAARFTPRAQVSQMLDVYARALERARLGRCPPDDMLRLLRPFPRLRLEPRQRPFPARRHARAARAGHEATALEPEDGWSREPAARRSGAGGARGLRPGRSPA